MVEIDGWNTRRSKRIVAKDFALKSSLWSEGVFRLEHETQVQMEYERSIRARGRRE